MLTSAPSAKIPVTLLRTALQPWQKGKGRNSSQPLLQALLCSRPTYAQDLIWAEDEDEMTTRPLTLIQASEIMPPLTPVPSNEQLNNLALNTIENHPELFHVSTSVNIQAFREFLQGHPHQPLVESVCNGLQQGFWPRAQTLGQDLPMTHGDVYPLRPVRKGDKFWVLLTTISPTSARNVSCACYHLRKKPREASPLCGSFC